MPTTTENQYSTHPYKMRMPRGYQGSYECGRCGTHTSDLDRVNCDEGLARAIEDERQHDAIAEIMDVTGGCCATCGMLLADTPGATVTPHHISRVADWPAPATDRRVVFSHHHCLAKAVKERRDQIAAERC